MRIPYDELFDGLLRVLLKLNFEQQRARLCARLFAEASRDGVYSHGLKPLSAIRADDSKWSRCS
jgi:3-dehydro-L-gulonate 2-dehydrogenase